jgi:hypothetical protein
MQTMYLNHEQRQYNLAPECELLLAMLLSYIKVQDMVLQGSQLDGKGGHFWKA